MAEGAAPGRSRRGARASHGGRAAVNSLRETPQPGLLGATRRQAAWLAAGIVVAGAALVFGEAEALGEQFRGWTLGISPWLQAAVVTLAMIALCRLRDVVFPGTEGTGIPQVIAALQLGDTPERTHLLSLRILVGKIVLLVIALLTGPTVGHEGPTVHVGAAAQYLASRWTRFPRHLAERGLILAGGAAGVAAAFNAPIAGITFAFEEIGRSFEKRNASVIVRTAVLACVLCSAVLGDILFYGHVRGQLPGLASWLAVLPLGLAGGLLGGLFARGVLALSAQVSRLRITHPWTTATALGLALATIGLASGGLSYGSGYVHARAILIEGQSMPWWLGLAIAGASAISLASAIPGGLFSPSLTVGAALGQLLHPHLPGLGAEEVELLVMAAYFAGAVQSPITAAIIVVEMTSARFLTLPLLAVAMLAWEVSRRVCPTPFYETLAERLLERIRATSTGRETAGPG